MTTTPLQYGAQEYTRWTGQPMTTEEYSSHFADPTGQAYITWLNNYLTQLYTTVTPNYGNPQKTNSAAYALLEQAANAVDAGAFGTTAELSLPLITEFYKVMQSYQETYPATQTTAAMSPEETAYIESQTAYNQARIDEIMDSISTSGDITPYQQAQLDLALKELEANIKQSGAGSALDWAELQLAKDRLAQEVSLGQQQLGLEYNQWQAGLQAQPSDWIERWYAERLAPGTTMPTYPAIGGYNPATTTPTAPTAPTQATTPLTPGTAGTTTGVTTGTTTGTSPWEPAPKPYGYTPPTPTTAATTTGATTGATPTTLPADWAELVARAQAGEPGAAQIYNNMMDYATQMAISKYGSNYTEAQFQECLTSTKGQFMWESYLGQQHAVEKVATTPFEQWVTEITFPSWYTETDKQLAYTQLKAQSIYGGITSDIYEEYMRSTQGIDYLQVLLDQERRGNINAAEELAKTMAAFASDPKLRYPPPITPTTPLTAPTPTAPLTPPIQPTTPLTAPTQIAPAPAIPSAAPYTYQTMAPALAYVNQLAAAMQAQYGATTTPLTASPVIVPSNFAAGGTVGQQVAAPLTYSVAPQATAPLTPVATTPAVGGLTYVQQLAAAMKAKYGAAGPGGW
ncbi:MAG: hypothetical protein MUP81_00675 [Dehalococcoidia bacterium]|nr:hypothetical protein [Dehalococcoidia bacterium]